MRRNSQLPFEHRLRALEESAARDETDIKRLWRRYTGTPDLAHGLHGGLSLGIDTNVKLSISNGGNFEPFASGLPSGFIVASCPAIFDVSINRPLAGTLIVDLTAGPPGTASPGTDYQAGGFEYRDYISGFTWTPWTPLAGPDGRRLTFDVSHPWGTQRRQVRVFTPQRFHGFARTFTLKATEVFYDFEVDLTDSGTATLIATDDCSYCRDIGSDWPDQYRLTASGFSDSRPDCAYTTVCSALNGTFILTKVDGDVSLCAGRKLVGGGCVWKAPDNFLCSPYNYDATWVVQSVYPYFGLTPPGTVFFNALGWYGLARTSCLGSFSLNKNNFSIGCQNTPATIQLESL